MLYLKPVIGIKGRIQSRSIDMPDDNKKQVIEVATEKYIFMNIIFFEQMQKWYYYVIIDYRKVVEYEG